MQTIVNVTNIFLASDMSCRSRLATLNEKLTSLERKIDYLEACVSVKNLKIFNINKTLILEKSISSIIKLSEMVFFRFATLFQV